MKIRWLAIAFAVFIIAIIVLADAGALPPFIEAIYDFPYGDKVGHFLLFGLLNFLITLSLIRALPSRDPKLVTCTVTFILNLLVGAEEYSQIYFPKRTFDLIDLGMSCLGLVVGGWFAIKL